MEQTKTIVSDVPEFENAHKQQRMQIDSYECIIQTFMGNSTTSCPL